jgi:hypothetical protein
MIRADRAQVLGADALTSLLRERHSVENCRRAGKCRRHSAREHPCARRKSRDRARRRAIGCSCRGEGDRLHIQSRSVPKFHARTGTATSLRSRLNPPISGPHSGSFPQRTANTPPRKVRRPYPLRTVPNGEALRATPTISRRRLNFLRATIAIRRDHGSATFPTDSAGLFTKRRRAFHKACRAIRRNFSQRVRIVSRPSCGKLLALARVEGRPGRAPSGRRW